MLIRFLVVDDDAESVEKITSIFKEEGYELISSSVEKKNEKLVCLFVIKSRSHINPEDVY